MTAAPVDAVARRATPEGARPAVAIGGITVDLAGRRADVADDHEDVDVHLTPTEWHLSAHIRREQRHAGLGRVHDAHLPESFRRLSGALVLEPKHWPSTTAMPTSHLQGSHKVRVLPVVPPTGVLRAAPEA